MDCTRKEFVSMLAAGSALAAAGCVPQSDSTNESRDGSSNKQEDVAAAKPEPEAEPEPDVDLNEFEKLAIDAKAWRYDAANDVYYQLNIPYCLKPAAELYESLAIFVPGAYFTAKEHGRTYECTVNPEGKVGSFTAATAPIVLPINSGTLNAQASPTSYGHAGLDAYLNAGFVYVYAGFRGRNSGYESTGGGAYCGGDPWPLVDLKAAVRCLRYNADVLPGNMGRIFTFGFSLGGGLSALMGTSGDCELYSPYLEEIGAATHDAKGEALSDATFGSASWCPITSFDSADSSYEWMMGQYATDASRSEGTWTRLLSRDLATAYGLYLNELGLKDAEGEALTLDETSGEVYADGTYYTHLLDVVQASAHEFFKNTAFPYTYTPQHVLNASFPGDPSWQSVGAGSEDVDMVTGDASAQAAGAARGDATTEGMSQVQSVVYNTQADYVNNLNSDEWWLTLNESKATARITSLGDFVRHLKSAAKEVCAFDAVNRSTVENQLFGTNEISSLHFSRMVYNALVDGRASYAQAKGFDEACVEEWATDLVQVDDLETGMQERMNMFNPLYFLCGSYEGSESSQVAAHWRINSGLFQTDTSLCTEANLALALAQRKEVADVAFTPVWGQGHVLAEVAGTPEENLVAWIVSCCEQDSKPDA
ncbi:MAG: tannase [Atopobiaceae bacterium]|nr:tannase [Atopobiaceae bacterium]